MIPRQGHIKYVKTNEIVGQILACLDIIYLYRQTDRQTDRRSLKHQEGSAERLFPDR